MLGREKHYNIINTREKYYNALREKYYNALREKYYNTLRKKY